MAYTIIGDIGECTLGDISYSFVNNNPCALMTLNNTVMFCDDVLCPTYTAGDTILSLPNLQTMVPDSLLLIPVVVTNDLNSNPNETIEILMIDTNGEISIDKNLTDAVIHLNGILYHVNSQYYTPSIGNIYNNGTSPLSLV